MFKLCFQKIFTFKIFISIIIASYLILTSLTFLLTPRFEFFWLFFGILIIEAMNYFENSNKTDLLYSSLPIKKRNIVLSNFIFGFFILAILIGSGFMVAEIMKLILPADYFGDKDLSLLKNIMYLLPVYSLYLSISFSIYYKFGLIAYPSGIILNLVLTFLVSLFFISILQVVNSLNNGIWGLSQFKNKKGLLIGFITGVVNKSIELFGKQNLFIIFGIFVIIILSISIKQSIAFLKKKNIGF